MVKFKRNSESDSHIAYTQKSYYISIRFGRFEKDVTI